MKIEVGQVIRFDTFENVCHKLNTKYNDRSMSSGDHVYGISKSVYKTFFENRKLAISSIRESDPRYDTAFRVDGEYSFLFDIAFIKRNFIHIDDNLFTLE